MTFWTDDLTAILADFGSAVTIGASTIKAIFDADYIGVGDVAIDSTGPALICRTSDVTTVALASTLVVGGVTYTVRSIQPDGTGITVLRLER